MRKRNGRAPCPACGLETSVINSRPILYGIRRRRRCPNGHRITTTEMLDGTVVNGEGAQVKNEDLEVTLVGLGISIPLAKAIVIQHRIAQAKR